MRSATTENLHYYLRIADRVIFFVPFLGIIVVKLDVQESICDFTATLSGDVSVWSCVEVQAVWQAILSNPAIVVLWLIAYRWFRTYRNAVGNELGILESLYTPDRTPHDWNNVWGRYAVGVLSVGFSICFLAMAWFSDNFLIFTLFVLALYSQDLLGNSILKRNLLRYFSDPRYDPNPNDMRYDFVHMRRAIATQYWVDRPQIERIVGMILASNLVLILSIYNFFGAFSGSIDSIGSTTFNVAVGLIATIIIVNETIMLSWRIPRDRALKEVVEKERQAAIANVEQHALSPKFLSSRNR